jgi:ABC-type Fe3+ transport system substrate-binding protein
MTYRSPRGTCPCHLFGAVALLALVLAGCQSAPPAASKAAAPTAAPATSSAATGAPSAAPAGSTASPEWDRLLAEAKREGSVRISVPAGVPGLGEAFAKAFEDQYGIKVDSTSELSTTARVRIEQEASAGRQTTDVLFGGASELITIYPAGLLAPIAPKLLLPEVTDTSKWLNNHLEWVDDAQQYMLAGSEWVHIDLMVNASVVDPKTITSWRDLLKPEYRGKIIVQDPHVGAGGATARSLVEAFGPDYIKALYQDQQPVVTRDAREVVQGMARGAQPIGLALLPAQVEEFRKQGFRLERVFPTDGAPAVSAGNSVAKLVKDAPHPNAAAVFVNWYASQRGQEIYSQLSLEPSRRLDVSAAEVPDYIKPKPGVQYRNQYQEDYYTNIAPGLLKQIEDLLGR